MRVSLSMIRRLVREAVESEEVRRYTDWVERRGHVTPYDTSVLASYSIENPGADVDAIARELRIYATRGAAEYRRDLDREVRIQRSFRTSESRSRRVRSRIAEGMAIGEDLVWHLYGEVKDALSSGSDDPGEELDSLATDFVEMTGVDFSTARDVVEEMYGIADSMDADDPQAVGRRIERIATRLGRR